MARAPVMTLWLPTMEASVATTSMAWYARAPGSECQKPFATKS